MHRLRYTLHIAHAACDTLAVPKVALAVPDEAPKAAVTGTSNVSYGTERAQTGTAHIGYIPIVNH